MRLTRRRLLAATSGAAMVAPWVRARAASKIVLRYGNNLPLTHPLNIRAHEAAARMARDSGGDLVLQIFPNNQLGGDTDMLTQVRSGALDFFTPSSLVIATLVPVAPINAVGFAFTNYGQVWAAMDGKLGAYVASAIDKVGLHMLETVWDNGFRQITTGAKPIVQPADMAGLKIRVPVSALGVSLFQSLGASPTSLQFSEVYTALQTHIVDAQENPLPIIEAAHFYEVQKHVAMTNHIWDGFLFIANGPRWQHLPDDVRAIAARALNQAGLDERADIAKLNATMQNSLTQQGMAFNTPDPAPFRETLRKAGFYARWQKHFGPQAWGLLESYVGKLA